jgi:hypothetical protein
VFVYLFSKYCTLHQPTRRIPDRAHKERARKSWSCVMSHNERPSVMWDYVVTRPQRQLFKSLTNARTFSQHDCRPRLTSFRCVFVSNCRSCGHTTHVSTRPCQSCAVSCRHIAQRELQRAYEWQMWVRGQRILRATRSARCCRTYLNQNYELRFTPCTNPLHHQLRVNGRTKIVRSKPAFVC